MSPLVMPSSGHHTLSALLISMPPIVALGSDALKRRIVPPVLRGEKIAALAISEPDGGSDVANVRTVARKLERREDDLAEGSDRS